MVLSCRRYSPIVPKREADLAESFSLRYIEAVFWHSYETQGSVIDEVEALLFRHASLFTELPREKRAD